LGVIILKNGQENESSEMKRSPRSLVTTVSLSAIGIAALERAAHISIARLEEFNPEMK
jgi:hypothetical protein